MKLIKTLGVALLIFLCTHSSLGGSEEAQTDIAIILSGANFHPPRVRVKSGTEIKLIFANINTRPGALILENNRREAWHAATGSGAGRPSNRVEIQKEISRSKLTVISLKPERGIYNFHDALSGAKGELIAE